MGSRSCHVRIIPPPAQTRIVPRVGPLICRGVDAS
jgi:hypothetical protein